MSGWEQDFVVMKNGTQQNQGKIIDIEGIKFCVLSMVKSLFFLNYPVIADIICNKSHRILYKIQPPVKLDERSTLFVTIKRFF